MKPKPAKKRTLSEQKDDKVAVHQHTDDEPIASTSGSRGKKRTTSSSSHRSKRGRTTSESSVKLEGRCRTKGCSPRDRTKPRRTDGPPPEMATTDEDEESSEY